MKTINSVYHRQTEERQLRTLINTVRELTVWLKTKKLYKQALKDTISLKYFESSENNTQK
jgi:hypothetical protein